jgi:hypothetical protein
MTQPALDFFKKRNVLIKAEATEGTDASPTGSTDGFRFFDGASSTEFDKQERNLDRDFFGGQPFSIGNKRAKIEGTFELYPPATPGAASTSDADCQKILLPAGMAVTKDAGAKTTTLNPISASIPSATAYFYHTGTLIKALGSRADISSLAIEIGQRFTGKGSLTGTYSDVSAGTPGTVTLPTKVPVVASNRNTTCLLNTLTRGGTASSDGTPLADLHVWAKYLGLDFGNALTHREYTEKAVNGITDRQPKFTLRLAKTDITDDFNPWYVRDNGIILTAELSLYEDDTKDGLFSLLGIRGQIENITEQDFDGDYGWELTGTCIPSDSGGDEFHLQFGDAST